MTHDDGNELAGARVLGGPSPAYLRASPSPPLLTTRPLSLPETHGTKPNLSLSPPSLPMAEVEPPAST